MRPPGPGLWGQPAGGNASTEAFMEDLCVDAGGYRGFFWSLVRYHFGWWGAAVAVPALFLDHHRCEASLPAASWLLYGVVLLGMLAAAVLLELSVVRRLGLLGAEELRHAWLQRRWWMLLASTVLWKLDSYTDIAFMFIARDCGSALWSASLAAFSFVVVFGLLLLNGCCSCSDCERELPPSLGFVLLDFKLVNSAVTRALPFDPEASDLPVARPVTLRLASRLVSMQKIVGDVAQVSIQILFLQSARAPHAFVLLSVLAGTAHGVLALGGMVWEFVQDEVATQASGIQTGTVLCPAGAELVASPGLQQPPQPRPGAVGRPSGSLRGGGGVRADGGAWDEGGGSDAGARQLML